ncbi:MAG: hypothetical protein K0S58_2326 [Nitrospira sp.]|nr:hypothetical protein [Nitrospira sp.]
MRGRRPGKTGGVFAEYVEDFFEPSTTQTVANRSPQQNGQYRTGS